MIKKLNSINWKTFEISDLFNVCKCSYGYKTSELVKGNIPYIARSNVNNGLTFYCGNIDKPLYKAGTLTIHHEWSDRYICFYQDKNYTTDGMIYWMNRIDGAHLTKHTGLFISTILNNTFAVLKKDGECGLSKVQIKLPVRNDNAMIPNWEWMENYMKDIERDCNSLLNAIIPKYFKLNVKWAYFQISNFFDITGTKTTSLDVLKKHVGIYPYVTTQATSNSIAGYYSIFTERGNVLVVDSAVGGWMSYQDRNFSASDHVEKLTPKFKMTKNIALFICAVWNKLYAFNKYSYAVKASQTHIRKEKIILPIDNTCEPNWKFMDKYMDNISNN